MIKQNSYKKVEKNCINVFDFIFYIPKRIIFQFNLTQIHYEISKNANGYISTSTPIDYEFCANKVLNVDKSLSDQIGFQTYI